MMRGWASAAKFFIGEILDEAGGGVPAAALLPAELQQLVDMRGYPLEGMFDEESKGCFASLQDGLQWPLATCACS
jgi:hypothetical protein